ncbi:MAG TPA: hypothetical protein VIM17_10200, partial [Jatrophihabitantaceae bacterium]
LVIVGYRVLPPGVYRFLGRPFIFEGASYVITGPVCLLRQDDVAGLRPARGRGDGARRAAGPLPV